MDKIVKSKDLYPIVDPLDDNEISKLGSTGEGVFAMNTGLYGKPKKGEWYLSGAIPEAYKAPNDLSHPYFIAKLVLVSPFPTEYEIINEMD